MLNQVQLITYVDRLSGSDLNALHKLLQGPLANLFGGIHLLPFYTPIDGSDAGFDPDDHLSVDPRLGDWSKVRELSQNTAVMADLIVNHLSSRSPQFLDVQANGRNSQWHDLFLTYDRVFPDGATEAELTAIYRPRPSLPWTPYNLGGEKRLLWTTFTPQQLDIDVESDAGWSYLTAILDRFRDGGVSMIRLDAAGYAIKRAGTRCFMLPETFDFIHRLSDAASERGMETLVEIHSHYQTQIDIAERVGRVYDFALPPLILHALFTGDAKPLANWLAISPRNCITVLDTHDGIGVMDVGADGDKPGLLAPQAIDQLVETIHERSQGESRLATGAAASNLDLYQVNCTYYAALGERDVDYLIARALQFFAPGVPQVYYTGLLAGSNDLDLLQRTSVGRDINRHYYQPDELSTELKRPVVQQLLELIRLRNTHSAFDGSFDLDQPSSSRLRLAWSQGEQRLVLEVDFEQPAARIIEGSSETPLMSWSASESGHV
ncbi:sucrose phosphorylase [Saccharospirillum sp. MSK14-1]|uniref:sucrose phosphorylase n=1 Tax=Saccharospirillum sp. MSK14-1 TaxID=1897632 RepID=UPI000D3A6D50|nr:sucrose phosphorylase [Saccharospirillum sp. MSK14-1]PTY37789.1 sucrose phosphorylase [Saccharospirillum sp. MSK14-1]